MVFDVTKRSSFVNLNHWIKEIRAWDDGYQICVVGNKIDLEKDREVTTQEAEALVAATGMGATYVEASAKMNINCTRAFEQIAQSCQSRRNALTADTGSMTSTVDIGGDAPDVQGRQNFACPCN